MDILSSDQFSVYFVGVAGQRIYRQQIRSSVHFSRLVLQQNSCNYDNKYISSLFTNLLTF